MGEADDARSPHDGGLDDLTVGSVSNEPPQIEDINEAGRGDNEKERARGAIDRRAFFGKVFDEVPLLRPYFFHCVLILLFCY